MKRAMLFSCIVILFFNLSLFAQIHSTGEGGNWNQTTTWVGGVVPTANDDVVINGPVQVNAHVACRNITVSAGAELMNSGHNRSLEIDGTITNNGTIRNDAWAFRINVSGSVTNNGEWQHSRTNLTGTSNRTLTLAPGKKFEGEFIKVESSGGITAATPMHFTESFNLGNSVLNMQEHALILETTSANVWNGVVVNTRDLILIENPALSNIVYRGDYINLKGHVRVASNVILQGNVTVADTLQNIGHNRTLEIDGTITNNGTIRNDVWAFRINVSGSVTNKGEWTSGSINLTGVGQRTIAGSGITGTFNSTGSHVILTGDNVMPNLTIQWASRCVLASGATLTIVENVITGELENRGMVYMQFPTETTKDYNFFAATARVLAGSGIDTLSVKSYGYQVPQTFANSVRTWWEFETLPDETHISLPYVTFHYSDEMLGNNIEDQIELYHSDDGGETWRQLSTSLNTTRNTVQKWVRVNDVPSNGSFLLSSTADPVSVMPSVTVSVIGRNDIRVGPPNRYSIHYVNNSDVPTEDFLMLINTQEGVHIERIEPSSPPGVQAESIPIDSLTYDGEDMEVYLWVSGMAPREERLFDVILRAYPEGFVPKKSDVLDPEAIEAAPLVYVAGVVAWIGVGLLVDYVADASVKVTEKIWEAESSCEEMRETLKGAIKDGIKKTNEEWKGGEKPVKKVAESTAWKVVKKTTDIIVWPVKLGKLALDSYGAVFRGAYRYVHGRDPAPPTWQQSIDILKASAEEKNKCPSISAMELLNYFNKDEEIIIVDCDGNVRRFIGGTSENIKTLRKVTSWDPNEKVAPAGYGAEGFISSAGRMNYQILFENLPAATAPAWRVIIVDTLSDVFQWETVEFGKTSHEGEEYEWKMTREGNILRWEIEDIELVPNVNPPEGEGYVTFSVMTKDGLPSGTQLRNRADIIFDFNPPIMTDEVINTLDFRPPVTTIHELPAESLGPEIVVRWTSDDGPEGSGVESTALFASKDGGGFFPVGSTSADSLLVPVEVNSRYSFYALSRDNVGNVESVRPSVVETLITGTTGGVDDERDVPTIFSLSQNYPNPFNPRTTIEFSLPADGYTTLKIYNILGQEVSTLLADDMKSGYYKVDWNPSNVSSGMYIYRLLQGDNMVVRRMMYLK